jgi:septum site-determining protein MinC
MPVAPGGHASASFDLKSASLTAVSLVLKTPDLLALEADMQQRWGETPDFFNHDAVVIDLSALASSPAKVAFATLIPLLQRYRLTPVGVRGGNAEQMQSALEAGLGEAPQATAGAPRVERVEVVKEVIREVRVEVPVEVPVQVPVQVPTAANTMIIDKPLRSGQQVYAKGADLIITAVVNHGAEVIADGSIHVYAPLRGKAIAGAKGNTNARIFSTCMEPELLSIAGTYRTTENPLPADVVGKPAQIRLDGERLVYQAIAL